MSLLLHMTPCLTLFDHRDFAGRDTKPLGNATLHHPIGDKPANSANVIVSQFCPCSFHTSTRAHEAGINRMALVEAGRAPFKVLSAVVGLIPVLVVDLILAVLRRNECLRNKAMRRFRVWFPAPAKRHSHIPGVAHPLSAYPRHHHSARRMPGWRLADPQPLNSPNAAHIGNLVAILKPFNGSPNLIHAGGSS